MRRSARSPLEFWFTITFVLLACATAAANDERREMLNEDVVGYGEYRQFCAVCHGVFADGEGIVAPVLKVAPSNLRTLAARHGRPLPRAKLREFIDGRRPVLAHGSREMPIWGRRLGEGYPNATPELSKRNIINAILSYLESIQIDPDA